MNRRERRALRNPRKAARRGQITVLGTERVTLVPLPGGDIGLIRKPVEQVTSQDLDELELVAMPAKGTVQ